MEAALNNTIVNYPKEKPLHSLFVESAAKYPDNIALRFHDTTLTYLQLNNTVNRLAAQLLKKGIKTGEGFYHYTPGSKDLVVSNKFKKS